MKRFQSLFLIALLLTIKNADAQVTNVDTMVHKIFAVLKAKDAEGFVALYPNKDQMLKLTRKMMTGLANEIKNAKAANPSSEPNSMNLDSIILAELQKKATPEEMGKMNKKLEKDFAKTIEQGEEKGVNWNAIQLINYTIDTVSMNDESMRKMFGEGYKGMKGVLHFKSADSAYQLSFDQVMFIPEEGGWYGVSFKKLAREGEPVEEEEFNMNDINMEMEEEPTKPKAKTKTTTKTKSTGSKTKTKSKTKS